MSKRRKKQPRKKRKLRFQYRRLAPGQLPQHGPEILSLESFTDANFFEWLANAEALQKYHYSWYFELEGQRAAHQQEIREALASQGACSVNLDGWGRQLDVQYVDHPLSSYGSLTWVGGRFNYGREIDRSRFAPFPALYLAQDSETAYREYFQLRRGERAPGGLTPEDLAMAHDKSFAWYRVQGVVHNTFDATSPAHLKAFARVISTFEVSSNIRELEARLGLERPLTLITTGQSLINSLMDENWRHGPTQFNLPANSQVFGRLLIDAGFEAVLYRSTKSGGQCLAIFTRELKHSETVIQLVPPVQPGIAMATLSATNCSEAERPAT